MFFDGLQLLGEQGKRCARGIVQLFKWVTGTNRIILDVFGILKILGLIRLITTWSTTRLLTLVIGAGQMGLWKIQYGAFPKILRSKRTAHAVVFLIPGYTNLRWQVIGFMNRLQKAGYHSMCALVSKNGNIDTQQAIVERNRDQLALFAQLVRETGKPVIFIGMSLGGCHAAWLAEALKLEYDIDTKLIITVQSPIRGCPLGYLGEHAGAQEVTLNKDGSLNPGVTRTITLFEKLIRAGVLVKFFCAIYDEVNPRRVCRLPRDGAPQIRWAETLPHIGHWGALRNPWAMDVILGFIKHVVRSWEAQAYTTPPSSGEKV